MKKKTVKVKKRVYLDYAAATPIALSVKVVMDKALQSSWANASSLHKEGEDSKNNLEEARSVIAKTLRCKKNEIYFTSGGTESINIAINGIISSSFEYTSTPHVITTSIEHPSVIATIKKWAKNGVNVSIVSPDENGIINVKTVNDLIKKDTVLVCVMHSNNEIGCIEPIRNIGNSIKEYRDKNKTSYPYLMTDTSQSVLYHDIAPERLMVDVLIMDGIKMYGPRGVGILFVKHGVKMAGTILGGGQEGGLRAGTENVIGAIGIAEALTLANKLREKEVKRLTLLRDYAIEKILKTFTESSLNGSSKDRLPNNINICFKNEDSEFLVIKLDTLGIAASAASACSNLNLENSSYVVEAIGKSDCAKSSVRFTLGRETTKNDINILIDTLKKIIKN